MSEEDTDFLNYIELCCFLSAYFKLTVLRQDEDWQRSANEIVENCTPRCVETIIEQIGLLLADQHLQDEALLPWVTRFAAGWGCTSASEARSSLLRLRTELEEAMHHRHFEHAFVLVA